MELGHTCNSMDLRYRRTVDSLDYSSSKGSREAGPESDPRKKRSVRGHTKEQPFRVSNKQWGRILKLVSRGEGGKEGKKCFVADEAEMLLNENLDHVS